MEPNNRLRISAAVAGVLLIVVLFARFVYSRDGRVDNGTSQANSVKSLREKPLFRPGDSKIFTIHDFSKDRAVNITAVCQKVGEYYYIFTEKGVTVPREILDAVGGKFDGRIYPGYSRVFTGELSPGLNADHRVTILLLDKTAATPKKMKGKIVRGFYWQINELSRLFDLRSNESKILYIFTDSEKADAEDILETIVHETRHLKNWSMIKNNLGMVFTGTFFLATVFTLYLGLSHLYFNFMTLKT